MGKRAARPTRWARKRKGAAWLLVPFIFPIASVVHFYGANVAELRPPDLLLPLGISLGLSLAVVGAAWLALPDARAGAAFTSLVMALFYSYGAFAGVFGGALHFGSVAIGADKIVAVVYLAVLAGSFLLIRRKAEALGSLMSVLAAVGLALLASSVAVTAYAVATVGGHGSGPKGTAMAGAPGEAVSEGRTSGATGATAKAATDSAAYPDIYFIVLDGYMRQDRLRAATGYDNAEFIDYLKRRGFYVAGKSNANYSLTMTSLSSILNMNYLDRYFRNMEDSADQKPIYDLIQNNAVIRQLKAKGYKYVHIASMSPATSYSRLADANLNVVSLAQKEGFATWIKSTLAIPILRPVLVGGKRSHLRGIFSSLEKARKVEGPKFVFAHALAPHPEYVFDEEGRNVYFNTLDNPQGPHYVAQMRYMNRLVERFVDRVLSDTGRPAIIVIQGDHGWNLEAPHKPESNSQRIRRYGDRMGILNAYRLPGALARRLYGSVTPVNTFRIILSGYLGYKYPLLPDRSYRSEGTQDGYGKGMYRFIEITDDVKD